jgi:nucleoside-diphosphate kinase
MAENIATERTLIMIKPDAVQRSLTGYIISRFEKRGFKLVAAKFLRVSRCVAEKHYVEHKDKPFFDGLCRFLSSSPVMVMVWQGQNVIRLSRNLIGVTDAAHAAPGTIRGDYAISKSYNLVHGSDSAESAEYEIKLYFGEDEIWDYAKSIEPWLACKA